MTNNHVAETEQYIAAEFARYFPDTSITVGYDDEADRIHVAMTFADENMGIWTYTAEWGSDDGWYVFHAEPNTNAPEGSLFTVPCMPEPAEPPTVESLTERARRQFMRSPILSPKEA